jgi:hypothetical protein
MKLSRRTYTVAVMSAGLALAAVTGAHAAPNDETRSVFTDLPRAHPAYATTAYLQDDLGLFTAFPPGSFSGKRALTRYEFCIAVQQMHAHIGRMVTQLEAKPAAIGSTRPLRSPTGPPAGNERTLRQTFRDEAKIRRLLGWHEALLVEFGAELPMLGEDMDRLHRDLHRWKESTAIYAARAKVLFAAE